MPVRACLIGFLESMNQVQTFDEVRPLLFSIAYRMLGSVMEAEDILQETFLRWQKVAVDEVSSAKSYLSTVVTRLCIDHLRSARVRRETYVGPWLPEPLVADVSATPHGVFARSESLSMAFLVILESLSPLERAVFLLREVFDYDYPEIAAIVGQREDYCRQLASRARRRVAERRPRFAVDPEQQTQVVEQFRQTLDTGDVEGLLAVLDDEVTWWSDGGGLPGIARKPVQGAEKVARFVLNLRRLAPENTVVRPAEINGEPGLITYIDGKPFNTLSFELDRDRIVAIRVVVNPDKLITVPPLA
jgi:RNA polymerase sigma-70 factor (ECF subfamily)